MIMLRNALLTLHLVAVISWMAGLLYLYRLFVYHAEESEAVVRARFKLMEHRLYRYITKPAMIVAVVAGSALIALNHEYFLRAGWLHAKLALAVGMIVSTAYAARSLKSFALDRPPRRSVHYRLMNEVPTLLMILIVALAIFRPG